MFGGLFDGALPVGMLLFLGTVAAYLRRRLGRHKAARDFPQVAVDLGLNFVAPRYKGTVGNLTGSFGGREVRVDPDDQRMVAVRFTGRPNVDIRTYEHGRGAPHGMVTVYSGDRSFDQFFRTRFADEEIAQRIAESTDPSSLLVPLQGAFNRSFQSLSITSEGVICRVDFGTPPYIPSSVLSRLLPACVALADLIEPRAGTDKLPNQPPLSEHKADSAST